MLNLSCPAGDFDLVFYPPVPLPLAGATVDRLLHHAHICVTTGDSIRLQQATTGKGVLPLT